MGQFDYKSVIDYIIVTDKIIVRNVKVMLGVVTLQSDHRLLVMDMKVVKIAEQQSQRRKVLKTKSLKDLVMVEYYKQ